MKRALFQNLPVVPLLLALCAVLAGTAGCMRSAEMPPCQMENAGITAGSAKTAKTVVLTFDDATKSQVELALPLLVKYNFKATFFICRFSDQWRAEHGRYLMDQADVALLLKNGMEVGNHTWSHAFRTPEEFATEVDKLDAWLQEAGCPPCVSFAYPGGPYVAYAPALLKARGYRCARALEPGMAAWTPETDPMHVPSASMSHGADDLLYRALEYGRNGDPVVILYHGVPDVVHPRANTDFADFARQMQYLYDHGYEVISMRQALQRLEERKAHGTEAGTSGKAK